MKNCAVGMLKLEADYRQTRSIARLLISATAELLVSYPPCIRRPRYRGVTVGILPSRLVWNKNLAIANRSRVSYAQYAEGIYRHKYHTVTLKSSLRVTQGH